MSEPHEPTAEPSGAEQQPEPPQAGAQPSTESEPTPSTAQPGPMFQPAPPAGQYVWVPAGRRPPGGFGRFVRHHGTHVVAAVVVGALVGGGTVAIMDNFAEHHSPAQTREGQSGGPFGGGAGHRFPGFHFGAGGQGSGN